VHGRSPPMPLLAVPNLTVHPSTASVPIIVLLYNGPLLCGFNASLKGQQTIKTCNYSKITSYRKCAIHASSVASFARRLHAKLLTTLSAFMTSMMMVSHRWTSATRFIARLSRNVHDMNARVWSDNVDEITSIISTVINYKRPSIAKNVEKRTSSEH